jgi:agmatinase
MRGAAYGPTMFRAMSDIYGAWGAYSMPNIHTMIKIDQELNIVDYGDAANDPYNAERSVHEIRKLVAEIAGVTHADGKHVIPIIIGGDHSLAYPDLAGLSDVYGKNNVGMIHFDAHYDGSIAFGQFGHNGAFTKRLIMEGIIKGENFIQIGLRGWYPDEDSWKWMRENKIKYHTQGEFERIGWEAVLEKVMKEIEAGPDYWFISFDMDVMDPTYAPAVGSPEPNGMITPVAFRMVRRLCAETNVIGMDLVEYNPIRDATWMTGQLANRIVREALVGIALRKKGITEKDYESELTKTHGQN